MAREEVVDFALRLVLGAAVALLDHSGELALVTLGDIKIVIGQLAPQDPGLALLLFQGGADAPLF